MRPFWILSLATLALLTSDLYADAPPKKPKATTAKKMKKKPTKKTPMASQKPPAPSPKTPPPSPPPMAPTAPVADVDPSAPPAPTDQRYVHLLDVGPTFAYAWVTPENNPTVTGPMGGIEALYQYRPINDIYLGAAASWKMGSLTHDPMNRTVQDVNIQERIGYTTAFRDDTFASFYSGVGVRYLPETVSSGSVSMNFSYAEFYAPVGFLITSEYSSNFSYGLNAEWRPHIFPTVHIQPLGGTWWSLLYRIDNIYVSLPIRYSACGDRYSGIIAPYFELWHDGASTATTVSTSGSPTDLSLGLPSNTYLFAGVTFSFRAEF
jgi:hypothetical protein